MSEKVILVHLDFSRNVAISSGDLEELQDLALSAGGQIVAVITGKRDVPDPKYFVGKGKASEIKQQVLATKPSLVIFDHILTPGQERNLEQLLECRVLGRTGLILDIFAKRARSFEGKLQVELAQLQYLSTRLVRGWGHLERQRGGIGLRGPGETQLETDRRLLRNRVATLKSRLDKVRNQRRQGGRARRRSAVPVVVLVGYTNAGKSTLFNQLTRADSFVADQLFATLDTTLRKISLPKAGEIVLADTVGFIRHLPHELVEAFRATLEETQEADLLLHVVDAGDPKRDKKIAAVNDVLRKIGAKNVQQLLVFNKCDLLCDVGNGSELAAVGERVCRGPKMVRDQKLQPNKVWISALKGDGMDALKEALAELLPFGSEEIALCVLAGASKLYAQLHQKRVIVAEETDAAGNFHLKLRVRRSEFDEMVAH